jgi:hypothetical protein
MRAAELLPHPGLMVEGGVQEDLDGLQAGAALGGLVWLATAAGH